MHRFLRGSLGRRAGGWRGMAAACALLLGASGAWAQEPSSALVLEQFPHIHATSPWYLPRQVSLTGIAGRAVTPQLRVGWEWTLIQERVDALLFVVEGAAGWAVSTSLQPDDEGNPGVSWFFEHTLQAGLGYRQVLGQDWAFGFKLTAGPGWVGARSPGLDDERALIGLVEGRFELGRFFGSTQVGVMGGIQTVMSHRVHRYASHGAGGVLFGIFANWR